MPNRRPLFPPGPRAFSAIPAYYTRLSEQPPTCPGLYCCRLTNGCYRHLAWREGAFWDEVGEVEEVSHWVGLPKFIQAVTTPPSLSLATTPRKSLDLDSTPPL